MPNSGNQNNYGFMIKGLRNMKFLLKKHHYRMEQAQYDESNFEPSFIIFGAFWMLMLKLLKFIQKMKMIILESKCQLKVHINKKCT